MDKTEQMEDKRYIFGSLLIISNKMDTLLERDMKEYGVTTKQWFLLVIIESLFVNPPTMKEVAKEMGSSHQNVKQIALKLQEKGLLMLEKDQNDARVTRLRKTELGHNFWAITQSKGMEFTEYLFKDIEKENLLKGRLVLQKMLSNLNDMESRNDERKDKI